MLRGVLQVLKIMTGKDVVIGAMVIDQNTKLPKAVRLLAPMLPGLKDTVICLDWPHTSRTMQEKQQQRFKNFGVFHPIANGQLRQMTDLPLKGTKKRKKQKNRENMRQKMVQN